MSVVPAQLRAFANLPPVNVIPDSTLQVYCSHAALLVVEDLESSSLSDDRLELIELNLAAHFAVVALERGGLTGQIVGESEETYFRVSDRTSGLGSTLFGQQAIALDTSGALSALATNPIKAKFEVI